MLNYAANTCVAKDDFDDLANYFRELVLSETTQNEEAILLTESGGTRTATAQGTGLVRNALSS